MPAAAKKVTTKAPVKPPAATSKSHAATHPTWVDMIKECIIAHPDDARMGVSRPMIKKFVESKYHIDVNATAASQLNRAIATGSDKGMFILPKGPSGKVKLAAKARSDPSKENDKPVPKKVVTVKPSPKAKAAKAKPVSARARIAPVKKSVPSRPTQKQPAITKSIPGDKAKKPAPATTKASIKKPAVTAKKEIMVKRSPAIPKKAARKKGVAKKVITGTPKKPAPKSKPAATTASKSRSRATAAHTKPKAVPSKTKLASKSTPTKKPASKKEKA